MVRKTNKVTTDMELIDNISTKSDGSRPDMKIRPDVTAVERLFKPRSPTIEIKTP